jgi:CheY-like chemotaxis protein
MDVVEAPVPDPSPGKVRRVLVVEDNTDAATMLRMVLELSGHLVEVAASGGEALTLGGTFGPEVVLCDIGLPDMDGYQVARGLRASLGSSALLVALTGYGQAEDQRRALEAGFDRHLTKPVDPFVLEQLVAGEAT